MLELLSILVVVAIGAVVYLKFMNKKAPVITQAAPPKNVHYENAPEVPEPSPVPPKKGGKITLEESID